ncbi:MAG: ABC transporter ATP-binding protein [Promethearchaeota archaeon]
MKEIMIKCEGVHKEFRLRGNIIRALINVNLEIEAGEFIMVQGPTGCGKTTLLNVMSGLDLPDEGSIILDGEDIARANEDRLSNIRRQKIGFVFQDFNLVENLTAIENVEALLWPTVLRTKEIEDRAIAALRAVDVLERKDHYPSDLSGGEGQRVGMARAIIHQPRVLFADEPTGNLDPASGKMVLELLKKLNRDLGTTMIVVTHDVNLVKYGDRVIKMDRGRVVR